MILEVLLLSRIYHEMAVQDLAKSKHAHVQIEGQVSTVKCEADGDWHIILSNETAYIVLEVIPLIPVTVVPVGTPCRGQKIRPVKVGQCVLVRGIHRFDPEPNHGWHEVHPVESLIVVACK